MTGTIHVIAQVTARPDQVADLRALLLDLIEPTRLEAGCIRYELMQNSTTPTEFVFVEEWQDAEAESNHLRSSHIQQAFRAAESLLAAPPQIQRYRLLA